MLKPEVMAKLAERQEQLADLFIDETDSAKWKDLSTKDQRGDVYWLKKNAAQTMGLIVRIQTLFQWMRKPAITDPEKKVPGDEVYDDDKAEKAAIKEAERIIERAGKSNVVNLKR